MVKLTEQETAKMIKKVFPYADIIRSNDFINLFIYVNDDSIASSDLKKVKGKFKVGILPSRRRFSPEIGLIIKINY